MAKQKFIHVRCLPFPPPVTSSLVAWLLLDRFRPDGWVVGVVATVMFFYWVAWIISLFNKQAVDIFREKW